MNDLLKRLESAEEGSRECVIWPRAKDKTGRGRIWINGKLTLAHRAVWEYFNGPIPEGKLLCHHCDNPSCVNLSHLYVGTQKDNVRDMMERKRHWTDNEPERARKVGRQSGLQNTWVRGADNPRAKLTEWQVENIRRDPRTTKYVAQDYGVNRTTIQRIRAGTAWTN